jgi:hypothetical protein
MRAAAIALAAIISVVAACSYHSEPAQEQARTHAKPFRTGTGTIQSVGVLRHGRKDAPAATGGSRSSDPHAYRLFLLMDSGGYATVDVDHAGFFAGESVEILADGTVRRVSGTTLNFFGK